MKDTLVVTENDSSISSGNNSQEQITLNKESLEEYARRHNISFETLMQSIVVDKNK